MGIEGRRVCVSLLKIGLVGVSCIDSGEHWLSDAVGGYLLGSAFLLVVMGWSGRGRPAGAAGVADAPVNESQSGRNDKMAKRFRPTQTG